jgi:hypothetical protein
MVVLDSDDLSGPPGTMAGPGVLLYLLYVSSIDHWQVQVEFPPMGSFLCCLCFVSSDGELGSLAHKVGTLLSLFLYFYSLYHNFCCWLPL